MSESKCWTLPQKVLDNECRIKKLEEKDNEYDSKIEEIDANLENKLDKITQHNQLYGTDSNGNQTSYHQASNAEAWSIPLRNQNGNIKTNNPIDPLDAVPLQYNPVQFAKSEYEKSLNLFRFTSNYSITKNGITITFKQNESKIIVNGTSTAVTSFWASELKSDTFSGEVCVSCSSVNGLNYIRMGLLNGTELFYNIKGSNYHAFNEITPIRLNQIQFANGVTFNNVEINILINKGTTPATYQHYNGEIIHSKDIEPVLLWSNPNLGNDFPGQTLIINNINNYKYIVFGYSILKGNENVIIYKKFRLSRIDGNNQIILNYTKYDDNVNYYRRIIFNSSSNSTTVYNCFINASNTSDNNRLIPVEIYGTNVL